MKTVQAIATQGRGLEGLDPTNQQFVTAYRVIYSLDCATFTICTDESGMIKVRACNRAFLIFLYGYDATVVHV